MTRGQRADVVCTVCSRVFTTLVSAFRRGRGRCCSLSCAAVLSSKNRDQKGSTNNNWRGGLSDNTGRKRRYRQANPEKHAAHLAMRNAIRRGQLIKSRCEVCGIERVEGHHDDYSRPLDVRWLCKRHHIDAHKGRFGPKAGIKPGL